MIIIPIFTEEETEAQRGQIPCQSLFRWYWKSQYLNWDLSNNKAELLTSKTINSKESTGFQEQGWNSSWELDNWSNPSSKCGLL